jgi:hypothetical protein
VGKVVPSSSRLTPRDLNILSHIAKNGFSQISDIEEKFFDNSKNRNVYRRLNILVQMGLIEKLRGERRVLLGVKIAKNKIPYLIENKFIYENSNGLCNSYKSSYQHDLKLQKIREVLEQSPIVSNYIPEHTLKRKFQKKNGPFEINSEKLKIPDALFTLKTPNETLQIALELECSRKSKARYRNFFKKLSQLKYIDSVFVLYEDGIIKELLMEILKEMREKYKSSTIYKINKGFYFIGYKQFLNLKLECPVQGENEEFTLKSLEPKTH